jgi:hypothetical protein
MLLGVGTVIGGLSALLGHRRWHHDDPLPALVQRGYAQGHCRFHHAGPIAVFGALGSSSPAGKRQNCRAGRLGYVYVPAVAGIGAASVLFAPLGVRLAIPCP